MKRTDLFRPAVSLADAHDWPGLQHVVRTTARALVAADGATFVLRDGAFCYYVDEDAVAPLWKGQRFPIEQCISGWAMLNGVPAVIPDITADPRVPLDAYRPTFVRSLAMVPVGGRDAVAAIGVYWARLHRPPPDEVAALQEFADLTKRSVTRIGLSSAPPWAPNFDLPDEPRRLTEGLTEQGEVEPAC